MNSFSLADCTTVEASLAQLKNGAVVKAGGVDLLRQLSVTGPRVPSMWTSHSSGATRRSTRAISASSAAR